MTIERRPFGRTGHESSAIIFGAAALWDVDQGTADRILDMLLKYGVNHIDTAPRYGDAEVRIGSWMGGYRDKFFLATKVAERDYEGAKTSLYRSLDRLRTDRIDLMQMHALVYPDDSIEVFDEGGALQALIEAREKGLIDHIGITGHGWTIAAMHLQSLKKFDFDSILMPWNWFASNHIYYRPDFDETTAYCREHGIAVQTIKALARGAWAAGATRNRNTWYQPVEDKRAIRDCVHWVLGEPDIFLNSVGDLELLPMLLEAADKLESKPDDEAMMCMADRMGLSSIFGV